MATFTMPLKRVIVLTGGTTEIVNGSRKLTGGNIGLDFYPLFDSDYRDHLNGIIVDHYWNREIGHETIDMFQLAMRRKMNEIMPYYNQFYESTRMNYDPLKTIDLSTINEGTDKQNSTSTSTGETNSKNDSKSRSVSSETPQTMLSGSGDYATAASDANSESTTTGDSSSEAESESLGQRNELSTTSGYQGVSSDLIMRYRDSLVNVDLMIINELQELFMSVWDTGDTYTSQNGFVL